MRILIFALGSRGDVQPFIALARGLVRAGHEVVFSAPEDFTATIEAQGLRTAPIPLDMQAMLHEPEIQAAMTSLTGRIKAFRWATDLMNTQLSGVWSTGLEVAPDLILHHFKAPLAPYLARRFGAVSIPVTLQPGFATTGEFPPSILMSRSLGRAGNRLAHRALQAVTRIGTNMMVKRWLKVSGVELGPRLDVTAGFGGPVDRLHAYSPTLVPRPDDWGPRERQVGYLFTEPDPDYSPPEPLAAFLDAGPPPLYAGFGSMPGLDHDRTTRALLGALEATGQRAVLTTGWGGISGIETGGDVYVTRSVPHAWLFPRVSAVIHHGGSGTTHEGLRWGRPTIVCPLFADQPFFGARVHAAGAGPAPIPQKKLTADALAEAIRAALRPEVAQAAEAMGERMRNEDAVQAVVDLVATLAPRT